MSYAEKQLNWLKENQIRRGDTVEILRKTRDYAYGWCSDWHWRLVVGKTYKVVERRVGTLLVGDSNGWRLNVPYFVLKIVGRNASGKALATERTVVINDDLYGSIGKTSVYVHNYEQRYSWQQIEKASKGDVRALNGKSGRYYYASEVDNKTFKVGCQRVEYKTLKKLLKMRPTV